jgi:DNA repair protein RadA/Sms
MADQDVFVNVVGGVKVTETSAPGAAAGDGLQPARQTAAAGSGGLWRSGPWPEIRPVPSGQERISEAAKHGFRRRSFPPPTCRKNPGRDAGFGEKLADALNVFDDL